MSLCARYYLCYVVYYVLCVFESVVDRVVISAVRCVSCVVCDVLCVLIRVSCCGLCIVSCMLLVVYILYVVRCLCVL